MEVNDGQSTKWQRNIAESFNMSVGRTNVTDDRPICDSKDPNVGPNV